VQPSNPKLKILVLKSIINKQMILNKNKAFSLMKENLQNQKVKNAVGMIEKMSKLSRGFIVANSLFKIVQKNHLKR
jgi:hypothetical protein